MSRYSVFNAMVDIVAAPGKALDEIKSHTSWLWWPLIITLSLASSLTVYYYNWVDFPWLVEETIRHIPVEDRAEQEGPIRQFMSVGTSIGTSVVVIAVMALLVYTVQATYLHLASKLTAAPEIGFGQWFSFSVWTAFVGAFGALAAFVVIVIADSNQLHLYETQVLSLNSLIVHAQPNDSLFNWANTLTLTTFWTLFLLSIGYSRWTGVTMLKSTVIAVLPWALVFGVWGAIA